MGLARRLAVGGMGAVAILGASLAWVGGYGPQDVYAALFGRPDLGPLDFATLERRSSPNDALACPPEICPKARADVTPPVYPVSAARLRAILEGVAEEEPRTQAAHLNAQGTDQLAFVQVTRLMRFPDIVNVLIVPRGENASTLAFYSRSQIGYSDFGVNRARMERWLARIGEKAAAPAS